MLKMEEPFGRTSLEALAGAVTISNRAACLKCYKCNNIKKTKCETLYKSIENLIKNKEKRYKLQKIFKNFTNKSMLAKLLTIID